MINKQELDELFARAEKAEAELEARYSLFEESIRNSFKEREDRLLAANKVLEEALNLVVLQFEDMQDSTDIREHWHKVSREALAAAAKLRRGE